ncbi:kinase-like protein [Aspergillus egyptiacus]|nr:kinase-like protein [Aspergillus egyptiacus]
MRFIAKNTTIPIPKVLDVEETPGGADKAWPEMDAAHKSTTAQELAGYVNQLRSLRGDYIGAADRGKAVIGNSVHHEGGPFEDEDQFNQFLFSKILPNVPSALRCFATGAFTNNHSIVFAHGDLSPSNILVDGQGHITGLIDWENAGWYPEYWEHARAYQDFNAVPGWSAYLSLILPPQYASEIVALSYLSKISR